MPILPDLATCKKIGFIVPSSNIAVETITTAVFHSLKSNVICLFTRLKVTTLGTDSKSTSQFTMENLVAAARLLADAEAEAILWNGTSGMWVGTGLNADRELAKAMQDATGVPCSTNTIATIEALELFKMKRISIAVPYAEDLTLKLVDFFSGCGYDVVKYGRPPRTPASNAEIARSAPEEIEDVIRKCAVNGTQVVIAACTNWPASGLVRSSEQELDVLVIDSILVTIWAGLRMVGVSKDEGLETWGQLMAQGSEA